MEEYDTAIAKIKEEKADTKDDEEMWLKKHSEYVFFIVKKKRFLLKGYVRIQPNYPKEPALFTLDIKDIETQVNNLPKELPEEAEKRDFWMISYQVRKCQMLFEE